MEKRKTKEGRYDYCKSNSLPQLHFVGLKHSFWPHQLILSLSCSFVPLLIIIKNKKIKSRIHHLSPHSRIKPGTWDLTTSPFSHLSHLATSLPSRLSHLTTSSRSACATPSIFRNLSLYSPPASPTLPTRYRSTFPTFPAHYPPIFPTLPLPFSSSLLTTLPTFSAQHLHSDQNISLKLTFFH